MSSSAFAQVAIHPTERFGNEYERADSIRVAAPDFTAIFTSSGEITVTTASGLHTTQLPIPNPAFEDDPMWRSPHLASVNWVELDSLHIVFYEESISTHGSFLFALLSKDDFQLQYSDFGFIRYPSPVNFRNGFIYTVSFGTVGKFDLSAREYVWQHRDLYSREYSTFNLINGPQFLNGNLLYTSESQGLRRSRTDTLLVSDVDGTILRLTTKE